MFDHKRLACAQTAAVLWYPAASESEWLQGDGSSSGPSRVEFRALGLGGMC